NSLHVKPGVLHCIFGTPAALPRDDVRGVPVRPMVLRSGRFVFAVMLLRLFEKRRQRGYVHAAESASRNPRRDLLQDPAVAVRVIERREREIRATLRIRSGNASLRSGELDEVVVEVK